MRRLILTELLLSLWFAGICCAENYGSPNAQVIVQPLPPVGQIADIGALSPDNPIHKPILSWIENYRQKSAELNANLNSPEPSKQDLIAPNYASINAAIRSAGNQPQTNVAANPGLPTYYEDLLKSNTQSEKPILLDTSGLSQVLTPYAFAQNNGQNGQQGGHSGHGQGDRIVVDRDMAMRLFDQNQKRIQKLDPVVQDHIRKLQEQSLSDGRAVFVDVKGDNTRDDSSLLEKLRPMLYDPSVLDEMKPQLRESTSMLNNKDNLVLKRPVLQYDRPLLEQRDKIEELRHALEERRVSANRPIYEESSRGQFSGQFLPQNQQPFQLHNQSPVTPLVTDKSQLIKQIEALALQPLLAQPQPKPPVPQLVNDVRQPLILGTPNNQNYPRQSGNDQAVLLGQRPRQQTQQPQYTEQPLTFNWGNGGHVQPENGDQNHQVAKRQEDDWNPPDSKWDYNDPDPQKQKLLREDLIRHLEEQERKRQELMELDLKQREMIAEERVKQEERDRQEAERRAMIKERQKKQQGNGRDRQPPPDLVWQPMNPSPPPPPPQNRQDPPYPKQEQTWSKPEQPWPKQEQPRSKQEHPWPKQEQAWPMPEQPRRKQQEQAKPKQDQPWANQEEPWQKQLQPNWQPVNNPPPPPLPIPAPFTAPTPQQKPPQIVSEQRWNSQEEPIRQILDKNQLNSGGPIDLVQTYPPQHLPQSQLQQRPPFANWPSNDAMAQIENNQKQSVADRVNGPIMISAAALAQAEQSDAEYVKLLREILLSQGKDTQLRPETRFVALDPQSIGAALTAQNGPQPADNGPNDWWKPGDSRPRMSSFGGRPPKEGSNR